jgi:hypothetical protein
VVAVFRKLFANFGMDEAKKPINAGIIVPLGGTNVVALEGGAGLQVGSRFHPAIQVTELKGNEILVASDLVNNFDVSVWGGTPNLNLALLRTQVMQLARSTRLRVFQIKGNNLAGLKATVEATDPKTSSVQATLACYVFDQKPVTVAYRPVQVPDYQGKLVPFWDGQFDPNAMIDGMNAIWTPQANVVLSLGRTDPAKVTSLKPDSVRAVIQKLTDELIPQKDGAAAFTMFLVRYPYDGNNPCSGVTDPKAGFCLINGKTTRTAAHELGHFLGSLSEKGQYSSTYGEKEDIPENNDTLMLQSGYGRRIPYGDVQRFNYRYRK